MSDLISKLSELRSQYNCFDESERDAYHTLSEVIEALQAQATLDDVSTAYENGYKQGKFEAQQWIPVSDHLPEYANYYLTSTEYDSVYCDFYDGYRFNRTEKVIAWMPLPEAYKAESEDEE